MIRMRNLVEASVVAAIVFAVDQLSKSWALEAFDLAQVGRVEVFPPLNFVFALNRGVNFGLFAADGATQQYLLAGLAVIISAALLVWAARTEQRRLPLGAGLVVGGALANALDRLMVGGVVDFINLDCCGVGNPFAFNIADVAIFFGAILVAWFGWSDSEPAAETKTDEAK